ncbi:MAG: hypothetical protein LBM65_00210, partial [Oscillospiraceae bacterium]|nr:hypothetical protein [Oscillospiraceae bacterium]
EFVLFVEWVCLHCGNLIKFYTNHPVFAKANPPLPRGEYLHNNEAFEYAKKASLLQGARCKIQEARFSGVAAACKMFHFAKRSNQP